MGGIILNMKQVGKHVGKRIKDLREMRKITQGELARLAGVKVSTLSDLENGYTWRPRGDTLVKLAAALDVEPDSIMSRDGISALMARPGSKEADLLHTFQSLSETNRTALLAAAHAMMETQPDPEIHVEESKRLRRDEGSH